MADGDGVQVSTEAVTVSISPAVGVQASSGGAISDSADLTETQIAANPDEPAASLSGLPQSAHHSAIVVAVGEVLAGGTAAGGGSPSESAPAPELRAVTREEMAAAASESLQQRVDYSIHPAWSAPIRRRLGGRFGHSLQIMIPRSHRRLVSILTWFCMIVVIATSFAIVPALARAVVQSQLPGNVWIFGYVAGFVGVVYAGVCWQGVRNRALRIVALRRHVMCRRSVADCVGSSTTGLACDLIERHRDPAVRNWGPFLFAIVVFASACGFIAIIVSLAERAYRLAAIGDRHVLAAAEVQQAQDYFGTVSIAVDYLVEMDLESVSGAYFVDGRVDLTRAVPFCAQFADEEVGTGCNLHGMVAPILATRPRFGTSSVILEGLCIGDLVPALGPDGDPNRRPADAPAIPPPGSAECTEAGLGVCGVTTALTPGQSRLSGNAFRSLMDSLPPDTYPVTQIARGPPILYCHSPDAVRKRYNDEFSVWEGVLWAWVAIFPLGFIVPRLIAHMLRECAVCGSPWMHHDDATFELGTTGFCINHRLSSAAARRNRRGRRPTAFSCGSAIRFCTLE